MKYCARCGTELIPGGTCPHCDRPSRVKVAIQRLVTNDDWITTMFRFLLVSFILSAFLFLIRWPIALATNPRSLTASDNFYYLLLLIAIVATPTLTLLARNRAGIVSVFLLAGIAIWTLPLLISSFLGQGNLVRGDFTSGALENLGLLLVANTRMLLPEVLVTVGFYLLSLAHLPLAFVGFFSIAQESVSKHLRSRPKPETAAGRESTLAIASFVAAFLAPIAGIVLSLIGMSKWPETDSRGRGLLIAALSISVISLLVASVMFVALSLGLFGEIFS